MTQEPAKPDRLYLSMLAGIIILAWFIAIKSCDNAKVEAAKAAQLSAVAAEARVNYITAQAMNMEGIYDPSWKFEMKKTREFFNKPEGYYRLSKSNQNEIPKIKAVLDSYGLLSTPQTLKKEELINNLQKLEDAFYKLRSITEKAASDLSLSKVAHVYVKPYPAPMKFFHELYAVWNYKKVEGCAYRPWKNFIRTVYGVELAAD